MCISMYLPDYVGHATYADSCFTPLHEIRCFRGIGSGMGTGYGSMGYSYSSVVLIIRDLH